jgi:hypothetical protein
MESDDFQLGGAEFLTGAVALRCMRYTYTDRGMERERERKR